MPTLFAIDTAGDRCSLALLRGGHAELLCGAPGQTHLEHVMPLVDALFARAGIPPAACDAFAFGSGPGAFTGLRVACTIAQGLAFGARRPVIAVGNLAALADAAAPCVLPDQAQVPQRVLAAIDARMSQAYVAVYSGAGAHRETVLAPCLVDIAQFPSLATRWRPDACVGDAGWLQRCLAPDIDRADPGAAPLPLLYEARVDAGAIVALAALQFARGEILAPEQAAPQYVRDDVARTVAQRQAARAAAAA